MQRQAMDRIDEHWRKSRPLSDCSACAGCRAPAAQTLWKAWSGCLCGGTTRRLRTLAASAVRRAPSPAFDTTRRCLRQVEPSSLVEQRGTVKPAYQVARTESRTRAGGRTGREGQSPCGESQNQVQR